MYIIYFGPMLMYLVLGARIVRFLPLSVADMTGCERLPAARRGTHDTVEAPQGRFGQLSLVTVEGDLPGRPPQLLLGHYNNIM